MGHWCEASWLYPDRKEAFCGVGDVVPVWVAVLWLLVGGLERPRFGGFAGFGGVGVWVVAGRGVVMGGRICVDLPRAAKVRNVVRVATDEGRQTPTNYR